MNKITGSKNPSQEFLYVLTVVWIILGLLGFPMLYLMLGFASGNASGWQRVLIIYLLFFYLQLAIQSFFALRSLKRIVKRRQYLAALICVFSPALLVIGIPVGMRFESEFVLGITLGGVAILQLVGSFWMWVLVATRLSKGASELQDVESRAEEQSLNSDPTPPVIEPESTRTDAIDVEIDPKIISRHNRVARIFLFAPVWIFVISSIATALVQSVDSLRLYREHVVEGFAVLLIASLLGAAVAALYLVSHKTSG